MNLYTIIKIDLDKVGDRTGIFGFLKAYFLNPGFKAVVLYRASRWFYKHKIRGIPNIIMYIGWVKTGAELPYTAEIGPGLKIGHPYGVVVGARCKIGKNCTIMQGVTLGAKWSKNGKVEFPVIGDDVVIGAGAKVLGSVIIGNNVMVGANAVVLKNIEDGAVAVGIPAKIISPKQ